jgi:hypothetical protein
VTSELHLLEAFPSRLRVAAEAAIMRFDSWTGRDYGFAVAVEGEQVTLPYRIYPPGADRVPDLAGQSSPDLSGLPDLERAIADALLTRHHNGHIRERHLSRIVRRDDEWVAPYVIQLLGEYVIEIHELIQRDLLPALNRSPAIRHSYTAFLLTNAPFIDLTSARIASYWNAYYRRDYPRTREPRRVLGGAPRQIHGVPADYPAVDVMRALRALI